MPDREEPTIGVHPSSVQARSSTGANGKHVRGWNKGKGKTVVALNLNPAVGAVQASEPAREPWCDPSVAW